MYQMCILEKLSFKTSRGSMPLDLPSLLAVSMHDPIIARPTLIDWTAFAGPELPVLLLIPRLFLIHYSKKKFEFNPE